MRSEVDDVVLPEALTDFLAGMIAHSAQFSRKLGPHDAFTEHQAAARDVVQALRTLSSDERTAFVRRMARAIVLGYRLDSEVAF